ncbi:MAG TPA: response regulator transcription factor, partial [Terriglobales bacterium]|nr:response regulator transcription factor [Terriglobales bacterium]
MAPSQPNKKIRVFVISTYSLLRAALRSLLQSAGDIEVVGEAQSLALVADAINASPSDVVLLDLHIPQPADVRAMATITSKVSAPRILVLSASLESTHIRACLAAGAFGYVLKQSNLAEVLLAVRSVANDHRFLDHNLTDTITRTLIGQNPASDNPDRGHLSCRELQVLKGIAAGFTNRELASKMQLSIKTVETYRARIYQKLHCQS